jgi:succinate-semialdehyde dehydrogenase/glutarate-semialdehyde dehydrogenase
LGGSDPYIVLEDADVTSAVQSCVVSRMINNGQSCIAAKRFIVHQSIYDEFLEGMRLLMSQYKMGDPLEPDTRLGPLARHDLRNELHDQVSASVDKGARVIAGGEIPSGPGAFYPPTVLTGVRPGMPAYDDELFGPVAAVIKVSSEDEAVAIANDTIFGLGAAVFTRDISRGRHIASDLLQAGCCFVNDFVRSDPRLPFGGIKQSGYGRELSQSGIHEFVNVKTILVKEIS